jgi:hypothetical protein
MGWPPVHHGLEGFDDSGFDHAGDSYGVLRPLRRPEDGFTSRTAERAGLLQPFLEKAKPVPGIPA